jgi:hypothetical protein
MTPTIWDRTNKNIVRKVAAPRRLAHNTLWMPGAQLLDFGDALYLHKKIGFDGNHILVERDVVVAAQIQATLDTMPWVVRPQLYINHLHRLVLEKPLDYAHFDFLGGLTQQNAHWISNNLKVSKGAEIYFTFTRAARNNPFFAQCEYLIRTKDEFKEAFDVEIKDLERRDIRVACYYVVLRSLLRGMNFVVHERPQKYRDRRHPMVMYGFTGFSKRTEPPVYPDILKALEAEQAKINIEIPIAQAMYEAKTPIEFAVAKLRYRKHVREQRKAGKCIRQVVAGFKAQITRMKNQTPVK